MTFGSSQFGSSQFGADAQIAEAIEKSELIPVDAKKAIKDFLLERVDLCSSFFNQPTLVATSC